MSPPPKGENPKKFCICGPHINLFPWFLFFIGELSSLFLLILCTYKRISLWNNILICNIYLKNSFRNVECNGTSLVLTKIWCGCFSFFTITIWVLNKQTRVWLYSNIMPKFSKKWYFLFYQLPSMVQLIRKWRNYIKMMLVVSFLRRNHVF